MRHRFTKSGVLGAAYRVRELIIKLKGFHAVKFGAIVVKALEVLLPAVVIVAT
jgi:hypothetical protein